MKICPSFKCKILTNKDLYQFPNKLPNFYLLLQFLDNCNPLNAVLFTSQMFFNDLSCTSPFEPYNSLVILRTNKPHTQIRQELSILTLDLKSNPVSTCPSITILPNSRHSQIDKKSLPTMQPQLSSRIDYQHTGCPELPDLDPRHVFQSANSQTSQLSPRIQLAAFPLPKHSISTGRPVFVLVIGAKDRILAGSVYPRRIYPRLSRALSGDVNSAGPLAALHRVTYTYISNRFTVKFPIAYGLCE